MASGGSGQQDESLRRTKTGGRGLGTVPLVVFIAVAHSQKRGGRKWGGQIGVTGGKGDRNEMAGIAGG